MPAYLIRHPAQHSREDILIEDPHLTLHFDAGWAILTDADGICLAIPSGQGAHIQRVDEDQDHEPAP
ncbi:hypothetical protein [Streptomyces lavendofoliae]|uniref:Uncharacterized protein n=1 Tax=Streptomyces lavendofoliae TaxID=67314 RepID=A0A918I3D2_9ACTN|nr:hypothetical protein [Streptomyces lavendofoliae]GGU62821.1 hypothetical protein GCM10010274_59570 [Streptomyces lavendofoliae]